MVANEGLGTKLDDLRVAALAAFSEAVAAGQPHRLEQAATAAYAAGASREDLLAALSISRQLIEVSAPVRSQAYKAIHAGHWMVARRAVLRRELWPQAA